MCFESCMQHVNSTCPNLQPPSPPPTDSFQDYCWRAYNFPTQTASRNASLYARKCTRTEAATIQIQINRRISPVQSRRWFVAATEGQSTEKAESCWDGDGVSGCSDALRPYILTSSPLASITPDKFNFKPVSVSSLRSTHMRPFGYIDLNV